MGFLDVVGDFLSSLRSKLRPGEPEPWDVEQEQQERQEQEQREQEQQQERQEQEQREQKQQKEKSGKAQFEPAPLPSDWVDESREDVILSEFDELINRIKSSVSASSKTTEADFLDDTRHTIVVEEPPAHMTFSEPVEAAIAAGDVAALAREAGTRVDDYLEILWERGDESTALQLSQAYEELMMWQSDTLVSAIDEGMDPSEHLILDVSVVQKEGRRLGYITEQQQQQVLSGLEYLRWQERGIELRDEPGEGKLAGTVTSMEEAESYIKGKGRYSGIAAPTYVVPRGNGLYDVYIDDSPPTTPESEDKPLTDDVGALRDTIPPEKFKEEMEKGLASPPPPTTTREAIALDTLRQWREGRWNN